MSDIIEAKFTEVSERSLDTITAEIVTITDYAKKVIQHSAVEVGRRLCEAKEQVPHGEWGTYLAERVNFSGSTANNLMRIFKEYGDNQVDLCGKSKSQTFGNLSYSKAVALFAVPEDEREKFVEENNVEEISVAELKKLIAEREDDLAAERRVSAMAKENISLLQNQLSAARQELQERPAVDEEELENIRTSIMEEAEAQAHAKAAAEVNAIKEVAEREKNRLAEKAAKLETQLKKAKDSAAAQAEKAVAEEKVRVAELEKKLAEAEKADNSVAEELKKARERAEQLEKKLKASDADSAKFALIFEDVQSGFNKLMGLLAKFKDSDPEKAEKLTGAIRAVLKNMEGRL